MNILGTLGKIMILMSLCIFAGGLNAWYGAMVGGLAGVLFMYWFWRD